MTFKGSHNILSSRQAYVALALGIAILHCAANAADSDTGETSTPSLFVPSSVDDVLRGNQDLSEKFRLASEHSVSTASQTVAETVCASRDSCVRNHVLPPGLLYRSYIAAPHEPRISSAVLYDSSTGTSRWDATLGGRVGLYRRDNPPRLNVDSCQWDLEGAVMVRLDPQEKMDLEASDYRFGLLWTAKKDNLAYKFGYFHVSSHIGDEFLIKNPTFIRVNYVRESLIFGTTMQASPEWRLYGEVAVAVIVDGGAEPVQFQFGAEYAQLAFCPQRGAPFAAINLQSRQEVGFTPGLTIMTGWQWKAPDTGKTIRMGLQFFNGPSNQYEFFQQYDSQLGFGIWYDF